MPTVKRSATLSIEAGFELPMGPPLVVYGKGMDGKVVCQLHINATGITITGPKGKVICGPINWDQLAELAKDF